MLRIRTRQVTVRRRHRRVPHVHDDPSFAPPRPGRDGRDRARGGRAGTGPRLLRRRLGRCAHPAVTAVLKIAATKHGAPYPYGATGPRRFDCSGLTQWVFGKVGKRLPRTATTQARATKRISAGTAAAATWSSSTRADGSTTSAIYAGEGQDLALPTPGSPGLQGEDLDLVGTSTVGFADRGAAPRSHPRRTSGVSVAGQPAIGRSGPPDHSAEGRGEGRPAAGGRADADRSVVLVGDLTGDGQTETGPAGAGADPRRVGPVEGQEDLLRLGLVDPGSVVDDADRQRGRGRLDAKTDGRLRRCGCRRWRRD